MENVSTILPVVLVTRKIKSSKATLSHVGAEPLIRIIEVCHARKQQWLVGSESHVQRPQQLKMHACYEGAFCRWLFSSETKRAS